MKIITDNVKLSKAFRTIWPDIETATPFTPLLFVTLAEYAECSAQEKKDRTVVIAEPDECYKYLRTFFSQFDERNYIDEQWKKYTDSGCTVSGDNH